MDENGNLERIPVYKSLYKPMLWGGLPRTIFIAFLIFEMAFLVVFRNQSVVLAGLCIYFVLLAITRYDTHFFRILMQSFKLKDAYFPD